MLDMSELGSQPEFDNPTTAYETLSAEERREMDYRANLQVDPDADLDTIRAAYRRLLRLYHPDLNAGDPEKQEIAEQITQRLNEAWDYLQTKLSDKRGDNERTF